MNDLEAYLTTVFLRVYCECGAANGVELTVEPDALMTYKNGARCHRCGTSFDVALTQLRQLALYARTEWRPDAEERT